MPRTILPSGRFFRNSSGFSGKGLASFSVPPSRSMFGSSSDSNSVRLRSRSLTFSKRLSNSATEIRG